MFPGGLLLSEETGTISACRKPPFGSRLRCKNAPVTQFDTRAVPPPDDPSDDSLARDVLRDIGLEPLVGRETPA